MTSSFVSIIVPCYNQAAYLDECLQSVLEQSYNNWECIIINDGSTDNSLEIINNWLLIDSRFRLIDVENGCVSKARNIGINKAIGEWILPLDADDLINTEYLKKASEYFNFELKVITCKAIKFGNENCNWDLPEFAINDLAIYNNLFVTSFFRKSDFELTAGFDEEMVLGLEDWDFWISLLKEGGNVMKLDYYGFKYRIKEKSRNSIINNLNQKRKIYQYIEKKHYDFFEHWLGNIHDLHHENEALKARFFGRSYKYYNIFIALFQKLFGKNSS